MMRVAYVSADRGVPIFGRKGCSIHAQEVLRALIRHRIEVDLFTTSGDGRRQEGLEPVRLHALPAPAGSPVARELAALESNSDLRAGLAEAGPFDMIYERYSLWSFAAMEFAREQHIPGLLEVNAPLIEEQAQYRVLVNRAEAMNVADRVFGAASALLAVSAEVAEYLETFQSARGKVRVVENGVRPERFSRSVTPSLPAEPGVVTVGFLGTLKAWHGLSVLVEAFALLHSRVPDSRLLLVGDGPERATLEADVAARGLGDAVHFVGAVEPERVSAFLASMDVAVAPYPKLEHFYFSPLKVYEYMAAGLPVVASGAGQLESLIQSGSNGVLVPPGNAAALAAALERLASDGDLRARLGAAGSATVLREHTWDHVVQRILGHAGLAAAASLDDGFKPMTSSAGGA